MARTSPTTSRQAESRPSPLMACPRPPFRCKWRRARIFSARLLRATPIGMARASVPETVRIAHSDALHPARQVQFERQRRGGAQYRIEGTVRWRDLDVELHVRQAQLADGV